MGCRGMSVGPMGCRWGVRGMARDCPCAVREPSGGVSDCPWDVRRLPMGGPVGCPCAAHGLHPCVAHGVFESCPWGGGMLPTVCP